MPAAAGRGFHCVVSCSPCCSRRRLLAAPAAAQDLQGHGGPVSALAVEGAAVLSGSFDTRAIVWDGESAVARLVLRFHDGSVTATAFLPDGGFATAGQDGRIALWDEDAREPRFTTALHQGPVAELAVSPDGTVLAAASWDGAYPARGSHRKRSPARRCTSGHGHRHRLFARWRSAQHRLGSAPRHYFFGGTESRRTLWGCPISPNGLAVLDTGVAVIFADGALRVFDGDGMSGERQLSQRPLVSIASSNGVSGRCGGNGGRSGCSMPVTSPAVNAILPEQGAIWSLAITGDDLLTGGGGRG